MKMLTVGMLEEAKACKAQVRLFRKVFPKGARITIANVIAAHEAGLDAWWAYTFLEGAARKKFLKTEYPAFHKWVDGKITDAAYAKILARAFVAAWKMQFGKTQEEK